MEDCCLLKWSHCYICPVNLCLFRFVIYYKDLSRLRPNLVIFFYTTNTSTRWLGWQKKIKTWPLHIMIHKRAHAFINARSYLLCINCTRSNNILRMYATVIPTIYDRDVVIIPCLPKEKASKYETTRGNAILYQLQTTNVILIASFTIEKESRTSSSSIYVKLYFYGPKTSP